jgi:hypothetical protein
MPAAGQSRRRLGIRLASMASRGSTRGGGGRAQSGSKGAASTS